MIDFKAGLSHHKRGLVAGLTYDLHLFIRQFTVWCLLISGESKGLCTGPHDVFILEQSINRFDLLYLAKYFNRYLLFIIV